MNQLNFLMKFTCAIFIVTLYYKFFKLVLSKFSLYLAKRIHFRRHYSLQVTASALLFPLLAISHGLFVFLILRILNITLMQLGIFNISPDSLISGAILGIGVAGVSAFFVQIFTIFLFLIKKNNQIEFSSIVSLKSGWMRHHQESKEVLPFYLWLFILLIQLSSEEIFFRGIYLSYFFSNGTMLAIVSSTILFIYMETFLMPTKISAMVPMVGAGVMGLSHGYLFSIFPNIYPLIISHCVFYFFVLW